MFAIYKKKIPKKGQEAYTLILTNKRLLARVNLGCHLSSLDIYINDGHARASVRFINTPESSYKNAPYRAEYVRRALERIGFSGTKTEGVITSANIRDVKRKDLPALLEETTRLFASTRDLDCNGSCIEGRVDKAVEAFFHGTTNIIKYLTGLYGEKN